MIAKIKLAMAALGHGRKLANSIQVKNAGTASAALAALLVAGNEALCNMFEVCLVVSTTELSAIAFGIVTGLFVYINNATSDTVGLRGKSGTKDG